MKYIPLLIVFICCSSGYCFSQTGSRQTIDIAGTIGSSQGSATLSYTSSWRFGYKKKFEVGIGPRYTNYFGSKKDFISSGPAKYTRTFTTAFLIFFAGQKAENFDTLTVQRPQINSLNAAIHLGYHINEKLFAGFNIDVIGFSLGRKSSSVFVSNGLTRTDPGSKPSSFNLLLTGDHDKGSLNSEFFLRYRLNPRLSVRAIYQFLFVEYTSTSLSQTYSDGKSNKFFRNKVNSGGLGLTYHFN